MKPIWAEQKEGEFGVNRCGRELARWALFAGKGMVEDKPEPEPEPEPGPEPVADEAPVNDDALPGSDPDGACGDAEVPDDESDLQAVEDAATKIQPMQRGKQARQQTAANKTNTDAALAVATGVAWLLTIAYSRVAPAAAQRVNLRLPQHTFKLRV
eukprot:COSAG05_NODE_5199_length_1239_cov_1.344737_2_plen_156_part_00